MSRCIPCWKWGMDGQSCEFTEDKGLYPCFGKKTQPKFKLWIKSMKKLQDSWHFGLSLWNSEVYCSRLVVLFLCGKHVGHASMRTEPDLHDYLAWFHTKSASEKTQWFLKWKNSFHSADGLGSIFFEDPALLKNHNFLQWSQTSNVSWPKSCWAFSPVATPVNTTTGWSGASLLDPVLLQWPGIAASAESLQKMGISTGHLKKVNLSKIILFHQCWRKICKELFGKNIQDKLKGKKNNH